MAARRNLVYSGGSDIASPVSPSDDNNSTAPESSKVENAESKESKAVDDISTVSECNTSVVSDSADAGAVTPIVKNPDSSKETAPDTTSTTTDNKSEKKAKPATASKSLKEIEAEIAANTAKFDEKTLSKDTNNSKSSKKEGSKIPKKLKMEPTVSVQPASIMRLIRLILVVAIATHTGYQSVQYSRRKAIEAQQAALLKVPSFIYHCGKQ